MSTGRGCTDLSILERKQRKDGRRSLHQSFEKLYACYRSKKLSFEKDQDMHHLLNVKHSVRGSVNRLRRQRVLVSICYGFALEVVAQVLECSSLTDTVLLLDDDYNSLLVK